MAMNPYQGDDIDPFSGARDKEGSTNTRPTYKASTADQMDERDRREMEMTKTSGAGLKAAAPTSFKDAFRAARNAGDKTFMFKGKKYTTDTASDKKAAPAKPAAAAKAEPEKGMSISEAGRSKMSMKDKLAAIREGSRNPNKITGAPAEETKTRSLGDMFSSAAKNIAKRKEEDVDSTMMKKGGKVAGYKKGGKIDGCAQRGKTKGRMI